MDFFGSLRNSLKQKWLQYYQNNRFWINLHSETVATPDGGNRPASYLILGVINVLEPQLKELMLPFSKLNPNVEALIDVLGLNFDPNLILGNVIPAAIEEVQAQNLLQGNVIREKDAFTIASLDQIIISEIEEDSDSVALNLSDDFSDVFLDVGEAIDDFGFTSKSDFTKDENQAQDISGLFPNL